MRGVAQCSGGCAGLGSCGLFLLGRLWGSGFRLVPLVRVLDGFLVSVVGLVGVGWGIRGWCGCWIARQYSLSIIEYYRPYQTTFQKTKIFRAVKEVLEGNSP